ncbi:phosphotransferase enzyme family protein [Fusibacter sp. 3D3]|uniref:phosphotransferase enzyme family protein n=1 Tax=Fusibacter sp. 3D3 TaxID=1048380 RepID=UPI000853676A|nr:phosphotransferase [Fusibacter sp. 3D3]GAU78572.1 putative protein kinase [Fusibacter sp. 3D3]
MLKLKYLFDNSELALMLLKNWNYDDESLGLFKYFRISSNAIYPFKSQGKVYFLRFVPESEKNVESISQELKFIEISSENGFNVPKVVESKLGNFIETKNTPWGTYHAVVFESAGDETLESVQITEEIAYQYGKSLADLHQISQKKIQSNIKRESIYDIFDLVEARIANDATHSSAFLNHVKQLRAEFEKMERMDHSFGLIHYDYELDNIIYDIKTQKLFAIDFDDCMYGFYGQDVERAINSIESEIEDQLQESIKESFIKGYRDADGNLETYYKNRALFKAFADMYSYFRMKASLEEKWDNEPVWMDNLRSRLSERMRMYIAKVES